MRMIAGAVLILAASVCAAGYYVATAANRMASAGSPLPFLAWVLAIGGLAIMVRAWMEELRSRAAEGDKPAGDKKK